MITIAVLPALFEEFAFCKFIFESMHLYGVSVAAVYSSALFGLMHQDITQSIFAFGMGLILCYVYEKTGRLIYTILLHFLNNAISVLLPFIPGYNAHGRTIEAILGMIVIVSVIIFFSIQKFRTKIFDQLRMSCREVKDTA